MIIQTNYDAEEDKNGKDSGMLILNTEKPKHLKTPVE